MTETEAADTGPEGEGPARSSGTWLRDFGPGLVLAATGVGAGDLATGALAGSHVGLAVVWAALVGATLKWFLTEGLARWQLVTGTTFVTGCWLRLGAVPTVGFLLYLFVWSFLVGAALMSACGAAAQAVLPLPEPVLGIVGLSGKAAYGIVQSLIAVALVSIGGYRLFELLMRVCIGVMVVTVLAAALATGPPLGLFFRELFAPGTLFESHTSFRWTVGLMGGVGGTATILCYGYWLQEVDKAGPNALRWCQADLAIGYCVTALFGIAMVVIGSQVGVTSKGVTLLTGLAAQLETQLGAAGPLARWSFLIGAWGAVLSSLLGVWQSVPYLFADIWGKLCGAPPDAEVSTSGWPYRSFLGYLAVAPAVGLWVEFSRIQLVYAVVGACFLPLLAGVLLYSNGVRRELGRFRNGWITSVVLGVTLLFFAYYFVAEVREKM